MEDKKEVFTIQIDREENGESETIQAMLYCHNYYSFHEAVEAGKEAYDKYAAIEDAPIIVSILGGEYELPNGDIYGEPQCIMTINCENRNKLN